MGGVATPFSGGFVPPGAPGSPESGGGGAPPQQPPPGMEALLGQQQQGSQPQDPQGVLRAKMMRFREFEKMLDGLVSDSGPDTAPEAREIKNLIRKMMQKAVARPGAVPEPPAPQSLG